MEAVWEIRFRSEKASIFELLLGMVYKDLSGKYPNIVRLPWADIPSPITEIDLAFRYVPKIQMEGSNYSVQIGEHMVSLSCRRPYSGWVDFSKEIRSLAYVLRSTMLIERLERFSLKYIDLIELKQPPNLECLDVDLKLGGSRIDTGPVQFRSELKEQGLTHIIQIVCPAKVDLPGDRAFIGVLLDIDTIHPIPLTDSNTEKDKAWDIVDRSLDAVHAASKSMFFKLLTAKTVESLEPVYSEGEVL